MMLKSSWWEFHLPHPGHGGAGRVPWHEAVLSRAMLSLFPWNTWLLWPLEICLCVILLADTCNSNEHFDFCLKMGTEVTYLSVESLKMCRLRVFICPLSQPLMACLCAGPVLVNLRRSLLSGALCRCPACEGNCGLPILGWWLCSRSQVLHQVCSIPGLWTCSCSACTQDFTAPSFHLYCSVQRLFVAANDLLQRLLREVKHCPIVDFVILAWETAFDSFTAWCKVFIVLEMLANPCCQQQYKQCLKPRGEV